MIQLKNLSKSYGSNQVLDDINLKFEKGKVYGIVGENGAGKSTLFRCIAGMESYRGEIISDYDHLKRHMGFLETNPIMMSLITGWEYLKLVTTARGISQSNFTEQNIFDLPLNQYADTYSTGMKKKLALLGILLQKNDVFILDEPFNGVDIHSNIIISELIGKLKSLNKIILISSHIFSTLSDNCDLIHLLKDGGISKTVRKDSFSALNHEMKSFLVGDRVDKLFLE